MSGTEALAVFGIVCNVMQVIGFVHDGAHMAKAIYKTSSLDPNLAQTTDYIKEGLERLKESLEKGKPLIQDEQELLDIANGSLETAGKLKAELDMIAGMLAKGKHSAAFRGWFKAVLGGKKRIERLEKVMHNRQQILENRLIVRICNKNDAVILEQQANFNRLDRALQDFIEGCARGQTNLNQLIQRGFLTVTTHIDSKVEALEQSVEASVFYGTSQLQDNISSRLQQLTHNRIEKEEHDRLLRSLTYETMNARRNNIINNHSDTMSWIFHTQHSNSDADNQNGFVEWLQLSRQRPYWISGKAGSGKSVLMKFLVDNTRTQFILDDANGTTIILSHFLWAAGQSLERKIQGLLCSLIHQLLVMKPNLCRVVLEKVPASRQKRFSGDWSTNELRALFVGVIPACGQHICIFLDGLDEMDDYMNLIGLLDQLCALPRLQICISSRPEPALQRHFHRYPQLRVQDLTRLDIGKYAHDTLHTLHVNDAETINRLVSTICSKADGVFLWVALALKSVRIGYDNHDDPAELELRLESLPNDLNTLYQQMWRRLNDSEAVYRETAARYFNLMLECVDDLSLIQTKSLLLLALALNPPLAAAVVTDDIDSWERELGKECERTSVRLPIRCAGLLEVSADGTVTLIHRSAQEFLMNTLEGQRIRCADPSPRETHRLNLMRGALGCCRLKIEAEMQTGPQTLPPHTLDLCQPLSIRFNYATFFFESCRDTLSPDSIDKLFGLAQVLYSTGKWKYNNSFYLQPDIFGAVARARLFAQVRAGFAQLVGAAPRGMRISRLYQAYILESFFEAVTLGEEKTSAQDLAFCCTLGNTSSNQYARYSSLNFGQSLIGKVGEHVPPFYLTSDPLELLMEEFLSDINSLTERYQTLDLMVSLLEEGYNLSNRTVMLINASTPYLSDIFRYTSFSYPRFVPGGTLFIEVNTSSLLNLFLRLQTSQWSLFPDVGFPALFERLKTAVGSLTTPRYSRLRAFVPKYNRADGIDPKTRPAEEGPEDAQSDEEDSDSDYHESNDPKRRAWASSTEVLITSTDYDSNAVLAALSGDIFTSIVRGRKLEVPDLEFRLRQILPNTRRSTVQELEEELVQDGFLVPWSRGPEVWPPRAYSPDPLQNS